MPQGMGAEKPEGIPNTYGEAHDWVPSDVEVVKVETPGWLKSRYEVRWQGKRIGHVSQTKSSVYTSIKGMKGDRSWWEAHKATS